MNPVEYFNKNNREKYWSKNEEKYKIIQEKLNKLSNFCTLEILK